MTTYRHRKGTIRENALKALLHDPLFKARTEVNLKGKGSYRRKDKHGNKGSWEVSGKESFTADLHFSDIKNTIKAGLLTDIPVKAGCSAV